MQPMAPRKTIVGPTGQTPIKTTTSRYSTTPVKTVVGSTARPPIKTTVGNLAAPPRKTVVGATAAPPLKTTASNLGVGSNGPRPRGVLASPNSSANVNLNTRSLGRNDGNPQRSVAPMPGPAQGAENPVLDHDGDPGRTGIQAGGMGPTANRMGTERPTRQDRARMPRKPRSQFFGE
jgi:hypothetical protein